MKTLQIYLADLKELLEARDFVSARTVIKELSPIDLADGWDHFDTDERVAIFRLSTRQKAMQVFEELESEQQAALVGSLQRQDAQELLSELDPSATSRMLRDLPPPLVRQLNAIMKKGGQERVQQYLKYPPESVGALMRGRYVTLEEKWGTKTAVERIQHSTRLRRIEETHLDTLMVVDAKGRLRGVVGLKSLVVAPNDMLVRDLMDASPRTLAPELDQEEAVKLFTKYKLKSAPVVDPEGLLLGVVVYRDIFAIAREETEEDFAKMAGYAREAGLRSGLRGAMLRLPWLAITCLGGVGVSLIVTRFEATLGQIIALASFSPMIAGMGGNVGSQTATIVVRGLATGEIGDGDQGATVRRELTVGLLLGLFYGAVVGILAGFLFHARHGWRFGAVVGVSMTLSILVSSGLAAITPLVLRRFRIDPATAAGPMTSTTTDLLSNAFYFTLATWLLLG
ncbi:MAG: magnesium transporter [Elusimicrobiota bacterium]|nr:magnesium transporter [Elusimicrobiota bacterium]